MTLSVPDLVGFKCCILKATCFEPKTYIFDELSHGIVYDFGYFPTHELLV